MKKFEVLFELGTTKDAIAVVVKDWEKAYDYCGPVHLAAFNLALFDTILNRLEDSEQLSYQKEYLKAINTMIKKKHQYDKFISQENYNDYEKEEDWD
jgi:hypothetical protein